MLSISFLEVRSASTTPLHREKARWSVRVDHGGKLHRTRFITLAGTQQKFKRGSSAAPTIDSDGSTFLCYPGWDEELEVQDSGAHDTIEVALDLEPEANNTQRATVCQSTATIDVSTFRHQPDKRCDLWLPLRAVAPHDDNSFDAIKLAVTYYSEDCVAQGYVFALFCGLVPLSVIEDVASLTWQIKGTARNTGRIQLYELPSATKEAPPLAALKIPGPIPSSCEMPLAAKVEHPPIGPRSTLG